MTPELQGYACASNRHFDQVAVIEGLADRLAAYHGRLPHSGVIPPQMTFSAAPRDGRLTANFFVQIHRKP